MPGRRRIATGRGTPALKRYLPPGPAHDPAPRAPSHATPTPLLQETRPQGPVPEPSGSGSVSCCTRASGFAGFIHHSGVHPSPRPSLRPPFPRPTLPRLLASLPPALRPGTFLELKSDPSHSFLKAGGSAVLRAAQARPGRRGALLPRGLAPEAPALCSFPRCCSWSPDGSGVLGCKGTAMARSVTAETSAWLWAH